CLNVMLIGGVNTLVLNGNPLLRYDGYYVLSDLLEVPNLRQKAGDALQAGLGRVLLGLKDDAGGQEDGAARGPLRSTLFAVYAAASGVYRWLMLFSILWFLNKVFEPYGLRIIGQCLAVVALYGLAARPLWRTALF